MGAAQTIFASGMLGSTLRDYHERQALEEMRKQEAQYIRSMHYHAPSGVMPRTIPKWEPPKKDQESKKIDESTRKIPNEVREI